MNLHAVVADLLIAALVICVAWVALIPGWMARPRPGHRHPCPGRHADVAVVPAPRSGTAATRSGPVWTTPVAHASTIRPPWDDWPSTGLTAATQRDGITRLLQIADRQAQARRVDETAADLCEIVRPYVLEEGYR